MFNPSFWQGKNIVITGASSGIGKAILFLLKDIPCRIFTLNRQTPPLTFTHKAEITQISCDISQEEQVVDAVAALKGQMKTLDVLFNNAGITAHGRFDQMDFAVFHRTFATNFFGTVYLTRLLIEEIKAAQGTIITTSTVSGLYGIPGRSVYSSSKAALHAVFESLRIELQENGVHSIVFCPPYTKTNLRTSGLDADGKVLNEAQHAGKIKTPEEVALAMLAAVQNPKSRLVIMDKSGFFVKWLRNLAPAFLEKVLHKKLYKDFH